MKKPKKMPVINIQEDEDFEEYILYPENAIKDTGQTQQDKNFKQNSKAAAPVSGNPHEIANKSHLTIVRSDD